MARTAPLLVLLWLGLAILAEVSTWDNFPDSRSSLRHQVDSGADDKRVRVGKCCPEDEIFFDMSCVPLASTQEKEPWRPEFRAVDSYIEAKPVKKPPDYVFSYGPPRCGKHEMYWDVFQYPNSTDKLVLLVSGTLRHYVPDLANRREKTKDFYMPEFVNMNEVPVEAINIDYSFGHYCIDKAILVKDGPVTTYAKICVPHHTKWEDLEYLIKKAIDLACHVIPAVGYLVVAVVYFVLPQLRDLVGNILTSMMVCLIVNQFVSFVTIFKEFTNHINFFIIDSLLYTSHLAAFFWLNALGYYVWNTFRSRNVFLRSTDARKYCCYSTFVWGSTITIAVTAIFAHITLETNKPIIGGDEFEPQETLGWLGLSVLFTTMAFTIVMNLCFALSTVNRIKGMRTFGRIHHKMKYSFRMFVLIFIITSINWLFILLSTIHYSFNYSKTIFNLIQGVFILYVCVFGQKRVTFLLGKTCNCCTSNENNEGLDWGEEMTAINAGY